MDRRRSASPRSSRRSLRAESKRRCGSARERTSTLPAVSCAWRRSVEVRAPTDRVTPTRWLPRALADCGALLFDAPQELVSAPPPAALFSRDGPRAALDFDQHRLQLQVALVEAAGASVER